MFLSLWIMGWQSSVNSRAQGVRSDAELKLLQQVTLHSLFLLGVVIGGVPSATLARQVLNVNIWKAENQTCYRSHRVFI